MGVSLQQAFIEMEESLLTKRRLSLQESISNTAIIGVLSGSFEEESKAGDITADSDCFSSSSSLNATLRTEILKLTERRGTDKTC